MRPFDGYYEDVDEFDDAVHGGVDTIRQLIDDIRRDERRFNRRHHRLDKQDRDLYDDFDDYDEDEFDKFSGLNFDHD